MRGVVHHLSVGLFGSSIALPDFPISPDIVGLGLSDWVGYARRLEECFEYRNTFYHDKPYLDITAPAAEFCDFAHFLISTDVLEHIPRPVELGFEGCFKVLKPGGLLVLTVPFRDIDKTIEHFPDLNTFRVVSLGKTDFVLVNRTTDGRIEVYEDLIFHGGPGDTLEMRIFGRRHLEQLLSEAGFIDICVHEATVWQWGVVPPHLEGLPVTARRP